MIFIVIIPLVAITMVLAWTNAGDGWWLLTAVLTVPYYVAVVVTGLWRSLPHGKRIEREDLPE